MGLKEYKLFFCLDYRAINCYDIFNRMKNAQYDKDEVIDRLLKEQRKKNNILNDIEKVLNSDPEFQGLSLVGGVKTILRRYREEKEKNFQLNKELNQIVRKKL